MSFEPLIFSFYTPEMEMMQTKWKNWVPLRVVGSPMGCGYNVEAFLGIIRSDEAQQGIENIVNEGSHGLFISTMIQHIQRPNRGRPYNTNGTSNLGAHYIPFNLRDPQFQVGLIEFMLRTRSENSSDSLFYTIAKLALEPTGTGLGHSILFEYNKVTKELTYVDPQKKKRFSKDDTIRYLERDHYFGITLITKEEDVTTDESMDISDDESDSWGDGGFIPSSNGNLDNLGFIQRPADNRQEGNGGFIPSSNGNLDNLGFIQRPADNRQDGNGGFTNWDGDSNDLPPPGGFSNWDNNPFNLPPRRDNRQQRNNNRQNGNGGLVPSDSEVVRNFLGFIQLPDGRQSRGGKTKKGKTKKGKTKKGKTKKGKTNKRKTNKRK